MESGLYLSLPRFWSQLLSGLTYADVKLQQGEATGLSKWDAGMQRCARKGGAEKASPNSAASSLMALLRECASHLRSGGKRSLFNRIG